MCSRIRCLVYGPFPKSIVPTTFMNSARKRRCSSSSSNSRLASHSSTMRSSRRATLVLSARNLPYVEVRDVQGLDPVALVGADSVVVTADAVKKIEEWLA